MTKNNITTTEDGYYLYNIDFEVENGGSTLNPWTLDFELPETILLSQSIFNSTETTIYTIENNIVKIESTEEFTQDTTKTINMTLAFAKEIEFDISNVNLNGNPLYDPTDRIGDFRITSYILNDLYTYDVPSYESKITRDVFPPADLSEEVINKFTFNVEWYDKSNNIYDNFEDVNVLKQGLPATIPITVSVTQLLNQISP